MTDAAEREMLYDLVRRFAREQIAPHVTAWDEAGETHPFSKAPTTLPLGYSGMEHPMSRLAWSPSIPMTKTILVSIELAFRI